MNLNALPLIAQKLTDERLGIKYKPESVLTYMGQNSDNFKLTIKQLRDKLLTDLSIVKEKIIPFTQTLLNDFEEKFNSIESEHPLSKYKMVMIDYPEEINHLIDEEFIGPIRESRNISNYGVNININQDNLHEYTNHPNADVDFYVKNHIRDNEDGVLKLLRDYLTNIGQGNDKVALLGNNVNPDKLKDFLILHTVLHNAKEIYNESPVEYQQAINELYHEINNYMAIAKNNLDNLTDNGLMLLGEKGNNEYYINNRLFNKYIDEGHNPNALIGYLINYDNSDYKSKYYDDIVENQDKYLAHYDSKMASLEYVQINLDVAKYKSVYEVIFSNAINSIPEELQPYFNTADNLMIHIRDYINGKQSEHILNPVDIIHNVIGIFLFPHTAYFKFIKDAKSYEVLNENITPQEAATFSATDMLFDYILSQFELVKV